MVTQNEEEDVLIIPKKRVLDEPTSHSHRHRHRLNQPEEPILQTCPICHVGLVTMSGGKRDEHVNACLDQLDFSISSDIGAIGIDSTLNTTTATTTTAACGSSTIIRESLVSTSVSSSRSFKTDIVKRSKLELKEPPPLPLKKYKPCPFYKRMPGTHFVVDAFRYGPIPGTTSYFLSHFHSDHYMGLGRKFSDGKIYCSPVTSRLVELKLCVPKEFLNPLEIGVKHVIEGVEVELVEANHCPGAVLFIFTIPSTIHPSGKVTRILHTGDFRAQQWHLDMPVLQVPFDIVYLDTTYCKPEHVFPAQDEVIQEVVKMVKRVGRRENDGSVEYKDLLWLIGDYGFKKVGGTGTRKKVVAIDKKQPSILSWLTGNLKTPKSPLKQQQLQQAVSDHRWNPKLGKTLFVVGTYTIGKERVFAAIARALNCKIYCEKPKMNVLMCLDDEDLKSRLTRDPKATPLHLVGMDAMRTDVLHDYRNKYFPECEFVIAFKPTGWTYSNDAPKDQVLPKPSVSRDNRIVVFGVPYSEHSSFAELEMFIRGLDVKRVIPTVNLSPQSRSAMEKLFNEWTRRSYVVVSPIFPKRVLKYSVGHQVQAAHLFGRWPVQPNPCNYATHPENHPLPFRIHHTLTVCSEEMP